MGLLGKLMIHLGLKDKEFQDGMKKAKDSVGGFGQAMQTLKASAIGAWTAISETIIKWTGKFVQDFLTSTQKIGDKFQETTAVLKAGYHQFIATISSGEGWSNLFSNIKEATRLAREAARELDEVFERKVSFSYQEAETRNQIAQQEMIMRDQRKTQAEREAAAKKIIELEKQLGTVKKDVWNQEAAAYRKNFQAQTQLNDEETDFLLKQYNLNRDIINQARAYNEQRDSLTSGIKQGKAASWLSGGRVSVDTKGYKTAIAELDAATDDSVKAIADMVRRYDKSNDDLVSAMAKAEVAAINVDTEVLQNSMRANSTLGRLEGGSGSGASAGTDIDDVLFKNMLSMLGDLYADLDRELEKVPPIELDPIKLKPLDKTSVDTFIQSVEDMEKRMEELSKAFGDAVASGFSQGIQTLTDGMMGLQDLNGGAILQALLEPLADLAIRQGEITMASGVAMTAIGKALSNPTNAPAAIAAGAALIAVGSAVKSGLASLANSMGGGASAASSTTSSAYSSANSISSEEIVVRVEGKISGNDILISGNRTKDRWNR